LADFLWRHCHVRRHSSLGGRNPDEVFSANELCSYRRELMNSGAGTVQ
jgi:putative transposase